MTRSAWLLSFSTLLLTVSMFGREPTLPDPDSISFFPLRFDIKDPEISKLQNGVEVYYFEQRTTPTVWLLVEIEAGSASDPDGRLGCAELTAEAIRRGGTESRNPDDVDAIMELQGISISSAAETDNTQLIMSCLTSDLDTGIDLFMDMILNPRFDERQIEISRTILTNRIRRMQEYPFFEASMQFQKVLLGDHHPAARIPSESMLALLTREHLLEFHRNYYKPNISKVGIVGNLNDIMRKKIEAVLSGWEGQSAGRPGVPAASPKSEGNRIYIIDKPGTQAAIVMGHLGPEPYNPLTHSLSVFSEIFGMGGMSSRLMNIIRTQKGYAYTVSGGFVSRIPNTIFEVDCQTKLSSVRDAIQTTLGIIDEMRTLPVSDDELKQAKESIQNSFVFNFERRKHLVHRLFDYDRKGFPRDYLEDYLDYIRKLSANDVMKAAFEALQPQKIQVVIVGPASELQTELEGLGWPIETIVPGQ